MSHIYLPLCSLSSTHPPRVYPKSGLNQWRAKGRVRSPNEVYVPYSKEDQKRKPLFFPYQGAFKLVLPNQQVLSAKVCQQGRKAIMSNPNDALGRWILRDLLDIPVGEQVTYEMLQSRNIEALLFYKERSDLFLVAPATLDDYEAYMYP